MESLGAAGRRHYQHPVVVLVVVTAGTLFGGVAGAFVAVPITAVVYRMVETGAAHRRSAATG
jgi:predicted PurR-regulated permease PerM